MTELQADLKVRLEAGLSSDDIAAEAARTVRAMRGWTESPTRKAALLAATLTYCANLSAGLTPVGDDPFDTEALRLAIRVQGIGTAARAQFAMMFPEDAARLDRTSMDRLVTAWTAAVEGGRWPAIAGVWKACFGVKIAPDSIQRETRKLPSKLPK